MNKIYEMDRTGARKKLFVDAYLRYIADMSRKPDGEQAYKSRVEELMKKPSEDLRIDDRALLYAFGFKEMQFAEKSAYDSYVARTIEYAFDVIDHSRASEFVKGQTIDSFMKNILNVKTATGRGDEFCIITGRALDHLDRRYAVQGV